MNQIQRRKEGKTSRNPSLFPSLSAQPVKNPLKRLDSFTANLTMEEQEGLKGYDIVSPNNGNLN